jgi:transcriptional regulator with XRE-family HTH domain
MDGRRVGRVLRAVRLHKRLRQRDVAEAARLSRSVVSRAEHGRLDELSFGALTSIAAVIDVSLFLDARWDDGNVDRLIDRAHAAVVEHVVGKLRRLGWDVEVEYGFNHFGDRGSVDVLAWNAATRTLLIVEVKSRLTDLQATFMSFARKLRIVPALVRRERGWDAEHVGRLIVMPGTTANRSIVARHAATFATHFPEGTPQVRAWLRHPARSMGGLWFVSDVHGANTRQGRTPRSVLRVRRVNVHGANEGA